MRRPRCFDDDEFADWLAADAAIQTRSQASSPCVDCTKAFATEMRALGCCDAKPRRQAGAVLAFPGRRRMRKTEVPSHSFGRGRS